MKYRTSNHFTNITAVPRRPTKEILNFMKSIDLEFHNVSKERARTIFSLYYWPVQYGTIPAVSLLSPFSVGRYGSLSFGSGNVVGTSFSLRVCQKGLNMTSGAKFAALPLLKPVVWFARAVVDWRSRSVAKSAYYWVAGTDWFILGSQVIGVDWIIWGSWVILW